MRRAGPFLLAVAALAAGCNRPDPQVDTGRRLVLSADDVSFEIASDDVPPVRVWAMGTAPEDQRDAYRTTATVGWYAGDGGSEWLSAEVDPFGRDPYGILLTPRPAAFRVPGSYTTAVVVRAPGVEARTVYVSASVPAPRLVASTSAVRFQVAPGAAAPAPATVLITPEGPGGLSLPAPEVLFGQHGCGEWIDAAVSTVGSGWALTLSPVGAALSGLTAGTTCTAPVSLRLMFEPAPGGGSPWYSSASVEAMLAVVDAPPAELAQVSRRLVSFSTLAGDWNTGVETVAVANALGGDLTRPAVTVSDAWFGASLSATRPYVVSVYPRAVGLPPGTYRGTVTVGDVASGAADRIEVTLEVKAWSSVGWSASGIGASATELFDGRLLVAGGTPWNGAVFQRCDPGSCVGAPRGHLATARAGHTATLYASGHLIAAGGLDPATSGPVGTWEIYDDWHAHSWYVERPLATPRFQHTATLLEDGRVLVAGGAVGTQASPIAIPDAELLDPAEPDPTAGSPTMSFGAFTTPSAPMNVARSRASAVRLATGEVLVAGGEQVRGVASSSVELFDPLTGRWSLTAPMNEPRAEPVLLLLQDGRVLAAGGTDGQRALATAEIYDRIRQTWTYTGSMSLARLAPGVRLLDGTVLVVGGLVGSTAAPGVTGTVERFDPSTGRWSWAAPLPEPRAGHAVTLLGGREVVVAGGTRSLPWDGSTMVWDVDVGYGVAP